MSKRGALSAPTTAAATSCGETTLTPLAVPMPLPSSVSTTPGMSTETSTPVPRSSARSASERPITPCLVAQ
jgi:hypothetical protein